MKRLLCVLSIMLGVCFSTQAQSVLRLNTGISSVVHVGIFYFELPYGIYTRGAQITYSNGSGSCQFGKGKIEGSVDVKPSPELTKDDILGELQAWIRKYRTPKDIVGQMYSFSLGYSENKAYYVSMQTGKKEIWYKIMAWVDGYLMTVYISGKPTDNNLSKINSIINGLSNTSKITSLQ